MSHSKIIPVPRAVTSLILSLSYRSRRPSAPFTEFLRLSKINIAGEVREENARRAGDQVFGILKQLRTVARRSAISADHAFCNNRPAAFQSAQ